MLVLVIALSIIHSFTHSLILSQLLFPKSKPGNPRVVGSCSKWSSFSLPPLVSLPVSALGKSICQAEPIPPWTHLAAATGAACRGAVRMTLADGRWFLTGPRVLLCSDKACRGSALQPPSSFLGLGRELCPVHPPAEAWMGFP